MIHSQFYCFSIYLNLKWERPARQFWHPFWSVLKNNLYLRIQTEHVTVGTDATPYCLPIAIIWSSRQYRASIPLTQSREAIPLTQSRASILLTQSRESNPLTQSRGSIPLTQSRESMPFTQSRECMYSH